MTCQIAGAPKIGGKQVLTTLHRQSPLKLSPVSIGLVLVASCTQSRPAVPSNASAPQQEAIVAKPFWIREARLPEGFPLPGPVGEVVIKEYPSYRMARFAARAGQPAHQDKMFWPLFNHIKRNDIAMTAPVEIGYQAATPTRPAVAAAARPVSMAFLYSRPTLGTTGVDQADPHVVVEDVSAMTVLSVGMRGDYTESRLAQALRRLDAWMADNPGRVQVVGEPRYLGYNSPMVPSFLRYGEVQLPVRQVASSSRPAPAEKKAEVCQCFRGSLEPGDEPRSFLTWIRLCPDRSFGMLATFSPRLALRAVVTGCLSLVGCSSPVPWPESPLYEPPTNDPSWVAPASKEEAMAAMAGHYAHYDVVAYQGETPNGPLSTFVISYGFTDLVIENGELVEYDRFCHAEQKANQPFVTTFPDAATQAIQPRSAVLQVYQENGAWKVRRPATPTLVGIAGDPDAPLSMDPNDPLIRDDDHDGKPGVTVFVTLFGLIRGEIYLARREIFQNEMKLYSDGSLRGVVVDNSEQLVVGASLGILNAPNNPRQWDEQGLSPIMLVPVPADLDTCEELMANRDLLFPPEPDF